MSDNTEKLEELKELMEKYNETVESLENHEKDERIQHLMHEVHQKILHLEGLQHHFSESENQKKEKFLKRHEETMRRINEQLHILHHYFELTLEEIEEEELDALAEYEERIRHVLEEIKRETNEAHAALHVDPMHPHPFPTQHHEDDEK
ncbi:MAG: hypothetical protein ACD_42C00563G0001 [uncultured bacterium]|nr:MAG: hypothetical protein ACD_42C00563G0001 [uncultured bacterium]OGT26229.1 MAG: hypothetical protein A3B71_06890 [Gammaproteobacteria bacterium RIFCSPHIGHO2_02_FULL_42_43]OGT29231.1 MAG: hypothetical protein A2624_05360 [Gammaproteobacteria bacterium RIFCSPHIGHO2_01_FULL_42_8]OGT52606.1 MAG: hypothetical protein A3E54_06490 [Gammaproteobacteria bacterium RIFCSPHIGHO2_12_FULL_41_25]OGT63204.1 MAG: hypothetical protein A3I77_06295 [Gammaproteobacteria bacterium RIFCSPLOWO2_02_FULL_42_14]OGT